MKVSELRLKLEKLEEIGLGDVPVEMEDSYWRNEGYGDKLDDYATSPINKIIYRKGKICLEEE